MHSLLPPYENLSLANDKSTNIVVASPPTKISDGKMAQEKSTWALGDRDANTCPPRRPSGKSLAEYFL